MTSFGYVVGTTVILGICGCRKSNSTVREEKLATPPATQPAPAPSIAPSAQPPDPHRGDPLKECKDVPNDAVAPSALREIIAKEGSVRFEGWNGESCGADCGRHLVFLPRHGARMTRESFAGSTYTGTYAINERAEVTMRFPTFRHYFPVMVLRRDSTSLLLLPKAWSDGSCDGGAGLVEQFDYKAVWPFRQVQVLDRHDAAD
jgi:hypothetical protein